MQQLSRMLIWSSLATKTSNADAIKNETLSMTEYMRNVAYTLQMNRNTIKSTNFVPIRQLKHNSEFMVIYQWNKSIVTNTWTLAYLTWNIVKLRQNYQPLCFPNRYTEVHYWAFQKLVKSNKIFRL